MVFILMCCAVIVVSISLYSPLAISIIFQELIMTFSFDVIDRPNYGVRLVYEITNNLLDNFVQISMSGN